MNDAICIEVPTRLVNDLHAIRRAQRERFREDLAKLLRRFWLLFAAFGAAWYGVAPVLAEAPKAPRSFVCGAGFESEAAHHRCLEFIELLRADLDALHVPATGPLGKWRWVIVAPAEWDRVRGKWGAGAARVTINGRPVFRPAFTSLETSSTFFTGELFDWTAEEAWRRREAVAHELGHIYCACRDEQIADRIGAALRAGHPETASPQSRGLGTQRNNE